MIPFIGGAVPSAVLQTESLSATSVAPTNATCSYTVSSLGTERSTINGVITTLSTWKIDNSKAVGDYECRATLVSGTVDIGTFGTWLNLASSATWTVQVTSDTGGTQQGVIFVEIRLVADPSTIIDTTTVTLNAEVTV